MTMRLNTLLHQGVWDKNSLTTLTLTPHSRIKYIQM